MCVSRLLNQSQRSQCFPGQRTNQRQCLWADGMKANPRYERQQAQPARGCPLVILTPLRACPARWRGEIAERLQKEK